MSVPGSNEADAASIVVIAPVLGRPLNAEPLARSLGDAHRLVFVCSRGDDEQIAACEATWADVIVAPWEAGHADFAKKCNLAYRLTDEPWLFQAADDVRFHAGWDTAALAVAERTGALVIGTQDGHNPSVKAGTHSTHTLIARSYVDDPGASMDGPGSVFSDAYGHQFCDTELVAVAKWRGVWAFADGARVTHEHPFWVGRDRMDATYRKGLASSSEDARLFRKRERMWKGVRSDYKQREPATLPRPGS